jgi:hypothetical protein
MNTKKVDDPASDGVVQNPNGREQVHNYLIARRHCYRPPTGLRASGFREGFTRGALDVLREIWPDLDDQARSRASELAARYHHLETA